jgi:hypothetical protein
MEKFSFKKGFGQVKQDDAPEVRRKIMKALNLNSRGAWKLRLDGKIEPKVTEAESIVRIFNEYGIFDIWGE